MESGISGASVSGLRLASWFVRTTALLSSLLVFAQVQRNSIDSIPTVRKLVFAGQSWDRSIINLDIKIDSTLLGLDLDAKLRNASMHHTQEALRDVLFRADYEKVIDQPYQDAGVILDETKQFALHLRVEVAAEQAGHDRALRDAFLLAVDFVAELDEIGLDVLFK